MIMIRVLIGSKGTGKTKTLISWVEQADKSEHGHVVCIAKDDRYNFSVPHSVRLIDTKEFDLHTPELMCGFLCGVISMNFDVTHIFIDSLSSIMKCSIAEVDAVIPYLESLSEEFNISFTLLLSGDASEAGEATAKYIIEHE